MTRLLHIEWLKNFSYKPFKIFLALYFIFLILLMFFGLAKFNLFGEEINVKEQGVYEFPAIWNFTTYVAQIFKIFLGFIVIFTVTQEFSNRMFKQNLIDGLSKKEFLASKLLTILVFTFSSTLIVFLLTIIIGKSYSVNQDNIFFESYFIGFYFLRVFTFLSFMLFIAILLRNPLFTILLYIVWCIIELVLNLIDIYFVRKSICGSCENTTKEHEKEFLDAFFVSDYLPLTNMMKLIEMPAKRTEMAKMLGAVYQYEVPTANIIISIIYIALFIGGSYWLLKKRDW